MMFKYHSLIFIAIVSLQAIASSKDFDRKFKCPRLFGLYPHSNQPCSRHYYRCKFGIPHQETCSEPMVFVPPKSKCKVVSVCLQNSTATKEPPTPTATPEETSTPQEKTSSEFSSSEMAWTTTTLMDHGGSTTTTTETTISTAESTTTSPETTASTTESETISPEAATSTTESTTTQPVTTTSTGGSTTTLSETIATTNKPPFICGVDGIFPNPNDCHSFYVCSNGEPFFFPCPADLEYNPELEQCEFSSNCSANSPTSTEPSTSTAKPPIPVCPPTGGSLLANPYDCHSFYQCSNGLPYLQKCPSDLVYNDKLGVCDWDYNVPECKTVTPQSFNCPVRDGNYADAEDCHKFYSCSNGIAHSMVCPSDLVYNAPLDICDWPENVPHCI